MTTYTTRTGLRIGSRYQANPAPLHHDADALRLQDAMLGNARRTDWDGLAIVAVVLVAIGAVAWRLA